MAALHELSAAELAAQYASRAVSPVDVTLACLEHIDACEGSLNAMYRVDRDGAAAAARAAEERWRAGRPLSPLDGVPVTIKENIYTRGDPAPIGTRANEDSAAQPADAPPSARARDAGCVILGKTTMPDYGMLSSGLSSMHGITRNPWKLDRNTSGLQPGDLVVVAGRPSMGKTALALNIAEHVSLEEKMPVAIFSMEMSGPQLVMRMLGSVGRLDQHRIRTGALNDDDWQKLTAAVGKLNEAPIFIDESGMLNPTELRGRARRLHRQQGGPGLGLIIVDYLQLMETGNSIENRATEVAEISRSLKAVAKELNVPVMALSQLNRGLEQRPNKRPVMSDLRESGAIEQDADLILFIYRDEVYNPDSPDKGTAEIIIGKQRNGPIGTVKLTFLGQYTRFENFAAPGRF